MTVVSISVGGVVDCGVCELLMVIVVLAVVLAGCEIRAVMGIVSELVAGAGVVFWDSFSAVEDVVLGCDWSFVVAVDVESVIVGILAVVVLTTVAIGAVLTDVPADLAIPCSGADGRVTDGLHTDVNVTILLPPSV